MNQVGEPAVAGDTGSAQPYPLGRATATAGKVQPAPGTKPKPGRPTILATDLHPQVPAAWYSKARPCVHCLARVLRRVERRDGTAFLRVQHARDCKASGK